LRNPNTTNRAARAHNAERRERRLFITHTLKNRVDTEAFGKPAHVLDCFIAPLTNDICCTELFRERNPVGMAI